ncbi:MAG: H4MPT-linked C1 transfer pathway protein [Planctomycetes bacterium]|nr:H4MPT-linked C1 transfer pathway protein [Planctomycetota bacterium]
MHWLGVDIGGANIKLADGRGFAASRQFALWRHPDRLAQVLRTAIAEAPPSDHLAITMTGELADCFENREQGVQRILDAVLQGADRRHVRVYQTDGRFVAPTVAAHQPRLVASANWLALAHFCCRFVAGSDAILLDIGSTTSDLIPIERGQPMPAGRTDLERFLNGELVYTGVERSPVCALVDHVPYRGKKCPVAQELFATAGDVYRILGKLASAPQETNTADQRPATRDHSLRRLGRMIGAEGDAFGDNDARDVAEFVASSQLRLLAEAFGQVRNRIGRSVTKVIVSGQGEFLARKLISTCIPDAKSISLGEQIGVLPSQCSPAHAVAVLAREAIEP